MLEEFYTKFSSGKELCLYNFGREKCTPGHKYGPCIRDFYLIHYVIRGKGYFFTEGKNYFPKEGQAFLIRPEAISHYEADKIEPWEYIWVGFQGSGANEYLTMSGFANEQSVISIKDGALLEECIESMKRGREKYRLGMESFLTSQLHLFFAIMLENNFKNGIRDWFKDREEFYLQQAIRYMTDNYADSQLTINSLAKYIYINRSYLSEIFKKKNVEPPFEYLEEIRLSKAKDLLIKSNLQICEIAISVGYKNYAVFSKAFKRKEGVSPSEFRSIK